MNEEQLLVSQTVDRTIQHYQSQFNKHVHNHHMEDAISIGDELYEWINDLHSQDIIYCNPNDLRKLYRSLRRRK